MPLTAELPVAEFRVCWFGERRVYGGEAHQTDDHLLARRVKIRVLRQRRAIRAATASMWTQAIYGSVTIAAVSRMCAVLSPSHSGPLLHVAALGWAAAFLGFAITSGPRSPSISALQRHELNPLRKIEQLIDPDHAGRLLLK